MTNHSFWLQDELPEVLSSQEITDLFLKYQKGDLSIRNVIMMHNIKLVISRLELSIKSEHKKLT